MAERWRRGTPAGKVASAALYSCEKESTMKIVQRTITEPTSTPSIRPFQNVPVGAEFLCVDGDKLISMEEPTSIQLQTTAITLVAVGDECSTAFHSEYLGIATFSGKKKYYAFR